MNIEMKPFGRPLSRLAALTNRQIEHLNSWLDEGVPYREIVDLFRSEYQTTVPKTTIQRYYKRRALCTLGVDLTEAKEAAAEFSKYAVTGNASFSTNTLEILEEKAFDLAVAHHRDADADDLSTLERVSDLIHKAKHTAVRERHGQVQEDKCKLRAEELTFKRDIFQARLDGRLTSTRNPPQFAERTSQTGQHSSGGLGKPNLSPNQAARLETPNSAWGEADRESDVPQNGWGEAAAEPTSISRAMDSKDVASADPSPSLSQQGTTIPNTTVSSAVQVSETKKSELKAENSPTPALTEAEITALVPHVISPRPLPPEVIRANLIYADKVRTGKIIIDRSGPWIGAIELPDTAAKTTNPDSPTVASSTDNHPQPNNTGDQSPNLSPYSPNSEPTSTPSASDVSDPLPTACPETKNSELKTQNSAASLPELAAAVDRYTVERAREHIAYEQKHTPWPHRYSPPEYITELRHCPCGHATPCSTHESQEFGPFPERFWKVSPYSFFYRDCLYARDLPYRQPREYLA